MRVLTDQEKAFVSELRQLMHKHCVSLDESSEYDGRDNYTGASYEIASRGDLSGIKLEMSELVRLLP